MKTKFFTFRQNNSGGHFDHDEKAGIGLFVVVEAVDADHANSRADSIGLYFDGCNRDMDCECCGDRWCPAYGDDGDEVPCSGSGKPIEEDAEDMSGFFAGWRGLPAYVHYLNGEVKKFIHVKDRK